MALDHCPHCGERLRTGRSAGDLIHGFWKFHQKNPHVYAAARERALDLRRDGDREKYGVNAVFEGLRWHDDLETEGGIAPDLGAPEIGLEYRVKLPSHVTAYYSRLLMLKEPELGGFFNTRPLRSPSAESEWRESLHEHDTDAALADLLAPSPQKKKTRKASPRSRA